MKHYFVPIFLGIYILSSSLNAQEIAEVAQKFNLYGGQKATIQWKRVFSSPRHLKRYKLDQLPEPTRAKLQAYLIKHAADSDQPIVPGL